MDTQYLIDALTSYKGLIEEYGSEYLKEDEIIEVLEETIKYLKGEN